jgi:3-oxoacyl-(acyl-carrier-protein) synthase
MAIPAARAGSTGASQRRRVVVTGIGAVTPIGTTIPEMWDSLVAGRSGVDYITRIDASTFPTTFGAEVRELDESRLPGDGELGKILDRKNLFGWVAAADALKDSRLLDARPGRIGVSLGTESRRPDFLPRLADGQLYPGAHDHLRFSPPVRKSRFRRRAHRARRRSAWPIRKFNGARPMRCSRAGATRSSIR